MKSLRVPIFVACLCLIVAASSSPAGINLSALNPFAKKKEEPRPQRFREPDRGFRLLPKINLIPGRSDGRPNAFQKLNQNTKKFFASAFDLLTPWDKKPETVSPNVTGSRGIVGSGVRFPGQQREQPKPNFFERLVGYDEPAEQDQGDVNDFLSQPRIGFR